MNYTQIHEVYDFSELQLIKSAFSAAEIDYVILDEYTLESGSTPIMGFSGARVRVLPAQKLEAQAILEELEFKKRNFEAQEKFEWVEKIEDWTQHIPFLGTIVLPYRLIALIFILVLALFFILWTYQ